MAKAGGFVAVTLVCLVLPALAGCATETWGRGRNNPPERELLLAEIDGRREKGIRESRRSIDGHFPEHQQLVSEDPEAARAAKAGKVWVASAAWWGWNRTDATETLRKAFRAPVDLLIIPAMEGPWITGPLVIDGPRHLLFEPGAELLAIKGAFQDTRDTLLRIYRAEDLRLTGYGAAIVMRKKDYTREPYPWSQHRHALAILESENIRIEGFTIESSGGDGIYLGQKRGGKVPRNILLKDLVLRNNYRQGVSVIAADSFRMEYSYIVGTEGTPPGAAVDFEPNSGLYGLTDCSVISCIFEKNAGAALTVHLPNVMEKHPPVSILIRDSIILGNPLSLWVHGLGNGVRGSLEFRNTRIRGLGFTGSSESFSIIR